jgi:hypothetical protein
MPFCAIGCEETEIFSHLLRAHPLPGLPRTTGYECGEELALPIYQIAVNASSSSSSNDDDVQQQRKKPCAVCGREATSLAIDRNMPPAVQELFKPTEAVRKAVGFRDIQHRSMFNRVLEESHQLRVELEQEKGRTKALTSRYGWPHRLSKCLMPFPSR